MTSPRSRKHNPPRVLKDRTDGVGRSAERIISACGLRMCCHSPSVRPSHVNHMFGRALKLRYSLPIVMPSRRREQSTTRPGTPAQGNSPLPSPAGGAVSFPTQITEDSILFDAPLVARLDDGWELMLERVVFKWMDAVVSERRGER